MSFDGADLEKMFAAAVEASEDTGEKDPSSLGKKSEGANKAEVRVQAKEVEKVERPKKQEEVERSTQRASEKTKPKIEEKTRPILNANKRVNVEGLNVDSIAKIIKMNQILDNYDKHELAFIKSYFQKEDGENSEIIYEALTAERRDLNALDRLVEARGKSSADRAFYLMELDDNSLEAVCEQIDLLTGELETQERINSSNKIKICRIVERIISNMNNDVFLFINKLQEFTSIAIQ